MNPSPDDAPNPEGPTLEPIEAGGRFRFSCHPGVPCFNACCRDLNQFLYPYDILRLARRRGLSTGEFLRTFTSRHVGPETGLPVVTLRPAAGGDRECPFLTGAGCSVYEDRPASCRTYPLARAVTRCRETGRATEHWAVLREAHCRGFETERSGTVADFVRDQEAAPYHLRNDRLLEIIQMKNRKKPGPLDLAEQRLFALALYDLDAFREKAAASGIPEAFQLDDADRKRLATDDLFLLEIAHRWVARQLFGEDLEKGGPE